MIKYLNAVISPNEIPGEICLNLLITSCPVHCPECHAKILWEDTGEILTEEKILEAIANSPSATCVCFMGGDASHSELWSLAEEIKGKTTLKIGWFSGQEEFPPEGIFDYVKLGPYQEDKGSLRSCRTNQHLYDSELKDITYEYWQTSYPSK